MENSHKTLPYHFGIQPGSDRTHRILDRPSFLSGYFPQISLEDHFPLINIVV